MGQRRVGVYVRVSTGSQAVAGQLAQLEAFAAKSDWKVVRVYSDEGFSGSRDDRPAFREMLRDAHKGRFNTIMAWSIDRISRDLQGLLRFVTQIESLGIDLFLLTQQTLNTGSASGRAMLQVAGIFSELELAVTKERIHCGLDRARAEGKRLGRPRIDPEIEARISAALRENRAGIKKLARVFGVGVGTIQRIRRELCTAAEKIYPTTVASDYSGTGPASGISKTLE